MSSMALEYLEQSKIGFVWENAFVANLQKEPHAEHSFSFNKAALTNEQMCDLSKINLRKRFYLPTNEAVKCLPSKQTIFGNGHQ